MKIKKTPIFTTAVIALLWLTACGSPTAVEPEADVAVETTIQETAEDDHHVEEAAHDEAAHDEETHVEMEMDHMHVDPPDEFASLTNPFAEDAAAIEKGQETFLSICSTCHGEQGLGDGPAAEALDPKPATLADQQMMMELSDGYLFWRISKGGQMEPFNSAMPAWETGLSQEQRWQLVSFLRTLEGGHMEGAHMDDHEENMEGEHSEEGHNE